jgi:RimJ/RimL family protein N-acetyltransferase
MRLITTENQDELRAWIERVLFQKMPADATFIGQKKDDVLVACIAYCNFTEKACGMHIGSLGDHWMSKNLLWAAFDYPFNKLKKSVIVVTLEASNDDAVQLNRHLGFSVETVIKDAHEHGDLMIMSMRAENCKWLALKPKGV